MATFPATLIENEYSKMTRNDFPADFIFGTAATSANQVEGAAADGGLGIRVCEETTRIPRRITYGNHPVDIYDKFQDDIKMMKSMGFDAYRFSISWTRLIPRGKICFGVNREGVDHYNDVINALLANGIRPHVTLFHWDLPDALEKEYGGFLSENIVDDYRDYVDLCFWEFGDRVKHWVTFNDPWSYCYTRYVRLTSPPGTTDVSTSAETSGTSGAGAGDIQNDTPLPLYDERMPDVYIPPPTVYVPVSSALRKLGISAQTTKRTVTYHTPLPLHDDRMPDVYIPPPTVHVPISSALRSFGLSLRDFHAYEPSLGTTSQRSTRDAPSMYMSPEDKEPFIAAKNMTLAHAAATTLYKRKYKDHQEGQIGIALNTHWFEGLTNKKEDQDAARRAHDFMFGWFLEPVLTGRYPRTLTRYVPLQAQFNYEESRSLRKYRIDFLGLNYYTARYVENNPNPHSRAPAFDRCQFAKILMEKDGQEIGPAPAAPWLRVVPWGIKKLLNRIKELYNKSPYNLSKIYITENGVAQRDDPKLTASEVVVDTTRVGYHRDHLGNILDVINEWKRLHMKMEIKGYFARSWIDNFERDSGYTMRFGLIYTDYINNLRCPKLSAIWFSQFLAGKIPKLPNGHDYVKNIGGDDDEDDSYDDDSDDDYDEDSDI